MKSWRIFRLGHTDFCIHPAFPLLLLLSIVLGYGALVGWMLVVLWVHESSHALAACMLGLPVRKVEFMPFGGVAQIDEMVDAQPWKEAIIAFAGPLSNLLMILFAVLGIRRGWWMGIQVQTFVRCNVVLFFFNLLPALPLDGGRVVKALLTPFLGLSRTTWLLTLFGMMVAAALLALGIVSLFHGVLNVTLFFTGTYLFYAAATAREGAVAQMVYRLSQRAQRLQRVGSLPVQLLAVSQDLPISQLPSRLSSSHYHMLIVVGNYLEPEAVLPESQLLDALSDHQGQTMGEVVAQDAEGEHDPKKKKMSFLF